MSRGNGGIWLLGVIMAPIGFVLLSIKLFFGTWQWSGHIILALSLSVVGLCLIAYRAETVIDKKRRAIVKSRGLICPFFRTSVSLDQFNRVSIECARNTVSDSNGSREVVSFDVAFAGPPMADGVAIRYSVGSFHEGASAQVFAKSIAKQVDLPVSDDIGSTTW